MQARSVKYAVIPACVSLERHNISYCKTQEPLSFWFNEHYKQHKRLYTAKSSRAQV